MLIEKIIKPEQTIVSMTRKELKVTDLPQLIGPTFLEIAEYIAKQNAVILSSPFVSFKNMDETGQMDMNQIEMEVGFPVDKLISETEQIKAYILPSYRALSTLYTGKYEEMTSTYMEMFEEIKAISGEFLGCSYEYYLSDEEIDPAKQETILELPYK